MSGKLIPFRRAPVGAPERDDEALLSACAAGEISALGELFDRYHALVHRFLARLSCTEDQDLDDLVQATFLRAYRSAGQFSGRSQVRTWLLGVAGNAARHHIRHEVRRRAWISAFAERSEEREAPGPDVSAERREALTRLAAALEKLPHELRVVFVMCDVEEIRGAEAARVLGVPEGTIWRRLHEARKALRAALRGDCA
jgi:RNA polymerase sigma-70 factor (ECF subfamily)